MFTKDLMLEFDSYYLFLDECGTAEFNDKQDTVFLLCCIKVEKNYYDKIFSKEVKKFKKQHKIKDKILHSSDIRKTRKDFTFLLNSDKRNVFFDDLSRLINQLDFEIFHFSFNKSEIKADGFDIYWFSLKEILLMIKNNLSDCNRISNVFCETRNKSQNNQLSNAYNGYFQQSIVLSKFKICFPKSIEFKPKDADIFEISGLEIADLVAFPIFNHIRAKTLNQTVNLNLQKNYDLVKPKIVKKYIYNQHYSNKKPPLE